MLYYYFHLCLLITMVFTIDMLKLSPTSSTTKTMRHVEVEGNLLSEFDFKVYQACYQIPLGKGSVIRAVVLI